MFRNKVGGQVKIATEFISPQKDHYGKELEVFFEEIIRRVKAEPNLSNKDYINKIEVFRDLEESTFKRFGLKVHFTHSDLIMIGVLPMILNKYHIFLDDIFHGFQGIDAQETVLKGWNQAKGTVDVIDVKVGGIFSTYVHPFMTNIKALVETLDMNASELAAIYLHEIGHLFQNYEFSNRLEATNLVLANLSYEMKKGQDTKKIEYLYKEFMEITNNKEDRDLLTKGYPRVILGAKLFKQYFSYVQSQWPNQKYNQTASEAGADLFSARFGYGRPLITGLDKIDRKFGAESDVKRARALSFFIDFWNLIFPTIMIGLTITSGAIAAPVILFAVMSLMIYGSGTDAKNMTYDDLKDRYTRIRQQYVQMLKDADIETAYAKRLVEDIYRMDDMIKNAVYIKPLSRKISNFIFSRHSAAEEDIQLQRLMEDLAHNDLFVKAAELNLMVKS